MNRDRLPPAIESWLGRHVPGYRGPGMWRAFDGGRSNPTYEIVAPSGRYVLRRQPPGPLAPSAHAVDREYRVLRAVSGTDCPVPRPLALCEERAVIGAIFYVMEFVPGRLFWSGLLPEVPFAERRPLHLALVEALAALHAVDWAGKLDALARPGSYLGRQVARWTRQIEAVGDAAAGALPALAGALGRSLPDKEQSCLIHGDYRIDNVIFAPDESRVAAVIDWELATIGDPLADLAYYLTAWLIPVEHGGMAGGDLDALGIPSLGEVADHYAGLSGRDVLSGLNWYLAFNLFRIAAMCVGIVERVRVGSMPADRATGIADRIPVLTEQALVFARRAGI